VREAGGLVTDYKGDAGFLDSGDVVAGNPRIIGDMLRTLELSRKS
jgi:myo-inositol-1(or 4)-monophosphatase